MKSITIQGTKRESVGKSSTKALRNAELVPCVVYGGENPIHFSTRIISFKNLVYTPEASLVEINLGSEKINAVVQDVQYHPVTDKIIHADFFQISDDKPVAMNIPVKLTGTAKGVTVGGSLRFNMRKLSIKAIPSKLPDDITIDITNLAIGDKIYIQSLKKDDYTLMHPDNAVVVAVRTSRAAIKNEDVVEDAEIEAEGTAE